MQKIFLVHFTEESGEERIGVFDDLEAIEELKEDYKLESITELNSFIPCGFPFNTLFMNSN